MSQSNAAQRVEDSERRKYRTEIPNMVDDMGLSVHAFRLYAHMKRVAGDSGVCWQSTRTLARACNMSVGKVSGAKRELWGKGLIARDEREGKSDRFTIVDVWDRNYYTFTEGRSPDETKNELNKELTHEERTQLVNEMDRLQWLPNSPERNKRMNEICSLLDEW